MSSSVARPANAASLKDRGAPASRAPAHGAAQALEHRREDQHARGDDRRPARSSGAVSGIVTTRPYAPKAVKSARTSAQAAKRGPWINRFLYQRSYIRT